MTATVPRRAAVRGSAVPAPRSRPAAAPRRPPLRVVDAPARRLRTVSVLGLLGIFGLLFGLVVFHTLLVQNQRQIDDTNKQIREAQASYQAARLKVAELEAPARVVAEATTRLGMVPPPGTTYLTPTPAAAAEVGAAAAATGRSEDGSSDAWSDVKPYLSEQR